MTGPYNLTEKYPQTPNPQILDSYLNQPKGMGKTLNSLDDYLGNASAPRNITTESDGVTIVVTDGSEAVISTNGNIYQFSSMFQLKATPMNITIVDQMVVDWSQACKGGQLKQPNLETTPIVLTKTATNEQWPNCFFSTHYTEGFVGIRTHTVAATFYQVEFVVQNCSMTKNGNCVEGVTTTIEVDPTKLYPYGFATWGSNMLIFGSQTRYSHSSNILISLTPQEWLDANYIEQPIAQGPVVLPYTPVDLMPSVMAAQVAYSLPAGVYYTN